MLHLIVIFIAQNSLYKRDHKHKHTSIPHTQHTPIPHTHTFPHQTHSYTYHTFPSRTPLTHHSPHTHHTEAMNFKSKQALNRYLGKLDRGDAGVPEDGEIEAS